MVVPMDREPATFFYAVGQAWPDRSVGKGPLTYADGNLYLLGENNVVGLAEATPAGYREKGRFTPPNPPKKKQAGQFAERAFTYPVIANGRLYIRDLETLLAYDIKASREVLQPYPLWVVPKMPAV